MRNIFIYICLFFPIFLFSQEEEEVFESDENEEIIDNKEKHHELGIDLNFWSNSFGGNVGVALKYATVNEEEWVYGPSFRYEQAWYNFNGIKGKWGVFGPGAFVHKRLYDNLYLGSEFELLSNQFINGYYSNTRKWVPVLLVGGGFSKKIFDHTRLNAGIMYDIINSTSSPFRNSYFMRKENGALIPVLYRITFFIDL